MNQHYRCVVYPAYNDSILVTGVAERMRRGMHALPVSLPHFTVTADAGDFRSLDALVWSLRALVRLGSGVYDRTPPAERISPLETAHDIMSGYTALEVGTINPNAEIFPLSDQ